ncbi:hypothetical protein E2C01_054428 [Portunus trituberculatus]|uniref:Secreted protein n=1 Tax=Portunus trituberculatus TaxID=210409 RepID=A0A5B7GUZ9_PORTR|nr:hypothetical protein [Portunus trituberculatus]
MYTFPLFALIHRVLVRVGESQAVRMTLVAPLWPQADWFPLLLDLLMDSPCVLPMWQSLLRHPRHPLFHDLSSLFRSFVVSCPPCVPQLPAWDLSLVLRSLLRPPYDPLRTASLRDVSLKTMFLLVLTSARRVSGLHGLSAEVCHSKGWTSMTFSFASDFLAKIQCPGQHFFNEFTIPAVLDFVREDKVDRLLCPVRAVCEYLHRTRDCRPACSKLLVTVSDPRRPVHPHTLSKWICQVIQRVYVNVSGEESRLLKVNAYEVRVIATSVLFRKVKSLDLVLKAGTWKSMTTFASFYLRDVTHRYLDTFSLRLIVSALRVVH